jgi:hypothetical protein
MFPKSLCGVAALLCFALPRAEAAPLQFVNGSFDAGLSGWNVYSGTPQVVDGTLSFAGPTMVQQIFAANGDRTIYEISFRMRSDPTAGSAWVLFIWQSTFWNAASTVTGQDWTDYTVFWTPAGFNSAAFTISVNSSNGGPVPFHFDNFSMTPLGQAPGVADGGSTGLLLCAAAALGLLVHRRGNFMRPPLSEGDPGGPK